MAKWLLLVVVMVEVIVVVVVVVVDVKIDTYGNCVVIVSKVVTLLSCFIYWLKSIFMLLCSLCLYFPTRIDADIVITIIYEHLPFALSPLSTTAPAINNNNNNNSICHSKWEQIHLSR